VLKVIRFVRMWSGLVKRFDADIFIVIGSTLTVYPVAGLIHEIPTHCDAFYIDPQADYSRVPSQYHLIKKTASEGMKQLFEQLKRD